MTLIDLAALAAATDGVAPFNEASLMALADRRSPRVLVVRTSPDRTIVGAAFAAGDAPVEVVVHPEHRRAGIGRSRPGSIGTGGAPRRA